MRRRPRCSSNVSTETLTEKASSAPATARVFFALWPPEPLAAQLAEIARTAAGRFGGRPTRQETIHLTLAFLGEVAESRLPEILRLASALRGEAFALKLDHLGFWRHNHLLWAGCQFVPPALRQLANDLRQRLLVAGFGPDPAGQGFAPHVSLVRRVPVAAALDPACPVESLVLPIWPCSSFVLLRSQLSSAGSDYRVLGEFPFIG